MRTITLLAFTAIVFATHGQLVFDAYHTSIAQSKHFVPNQGQFLDSYGEPMPDVRFLSYGNDPWMALEKDSRVSLAFDMTTDTNQCRTGRIGWFPVGETAALRDPKEYKAALGVNNYLHPHIPTGVFGVERYVCVRYDDIFPQIDWVFYSTVDGMRCAVYCKPGFNPYDLAFGFIGQDSLRVDLEGALRMYTSGRHLRLPEAIAYQLDADSQVVQVPWTATWDLGNWETIVKLQLGEYDPTAPLVLQLGPAPGLAGGGGGDEPPTLTWSTLLGSAFSAGGYGLFSYGNAAMTTPDGDVIITGNADDPNYPAVFGSSQAPFAGEFDIYYGRFNYAPGDPTVDAVNLYSTFVGGSGIERPQAALHTTDDKYYIAGWTNSDDLILVPQVNPNDGTYFQGSLNGLNDGFIIQLEPSDGSITRSAYLGGEGEEMITAITEDVQGNLVFAGTTTSTGAYSGTCNSPVSGFPLCDLPGNNYQQANNAGGQDAFLFRMDNTFHLTWGTLYGGPGDERLYDAASTAVDGGDPSKQLVILVGGTNGDLPNGDVGLWHQDGNGLANGWIATFNTNGVHKWGTNLHGLLQVESVTTTGDNIIIAGPTDYSTTAAVGCQPVAGSVSICTANYANAYVDATNDVWDEYYAQYNADVGNLIWSTLYGEIGAETANDAEGLYLQAYEPDPFRINRFTDLVLDADGNLYAMAIQDAADAYLSDPYPTLPAWGLYYKPWDDNIGVNQTDVTLKIFAPDRSLAWCSMFGSQFPHSTDPLFDTFNGFWGCDFGHQLLLVEDECFYIIGTSGGVAYDDECPYPGTSWCEPAYTYFHGPDYFHGFIARMNLHGISIGLPEQGSASDGLFVFPNPATDHVMLQYAQGSMRNCQVRIFDTHGVHVRTVAVQPGNMIAVDDLAVGVYHGALAGPDGKALGSFRFIKQ